MHYSEYNGIAFNYNSDYSGEIHMQSIHTEEDDTIKVTFPVLVDAMIKGTPLKGWGMDAMLAKAIRDFIAQALVNEAISELEQMPTDQVLSNPWLIEILDKLS